MKGISDSWSKLKGIEHEGHKYRLLVKIEDIVQEGYK